MGIQQSKERFNKCNSYMQPALFGRYTMKDEGTLGRCSTFIKPASASPAGAAAATRLMMTSKPSLKGRMNRKRGISQEHGITKRSSLKMRRRLSLRMSMRNQQPYENKQRKTAQDLEVATASADTKNDTKENCYELAVTKANDNKDFKLKEACKTAENLKEPVGQANGKLTAEIEQRKVKSSEEATVGETVSPKLVTPKQASIRARQPSIFRTPREERLKRFKLTFFSEFD